MNQNRDVKSFNKEIKYNRLLFSIPFIEWVCNNFTYDEVNLWKRKDMVNGTIVYTKEQLIKQYLNEN